VNQIATALKNNPDVTITPPKNSRPLVKATPFSKQSSLDKQAAAVNMAATKGRIAVTNKNRIVPTIIRKNIASDPKAIAAAATKSSTSLRNVDEKTRNEEVLPKDIENIEQKSEMPATDILKPDTVECLPAAAAPAAPAYEDLPPNTNSASTTDHLGWDNVSMDTGFVKESLDSLSSLAKEIPSEPIPEQPKQDPGFSQAPLKEEIKKKEAANAWPKGPYPVGPYGNFYPGYPGYYGPMAGYDPYHRGPFPPPPGPPIKTETGEGGSAPVPPAGPPLYPPYPSPYPYPPYNYHYPPQPTPAPNAAKPGDQPEPAQPLYPPPFVAPPPPVGPNPTPGYYPNYPPYRPPFPDPNYPYPNYNPYMPPGYGYPPHAMAAQQPNPDGSTQNLIPQGQEPPSQ